MTVHAGSTGPLDSADRDNVRAHLLMYDVPMDSKLRREHPSKIMWRYGSRINLSCWVVPDRNVALLPIQRWKDLGGHVELVRFDERDGNTIIRLAKKGLVEEIMRIRTGLDDAVSKVREKFEDVASGDDKALRRANGYGYRYIRNAKRFIVDARECALAFDLMGEVDELMDGLRNVVKAREELFYAMYVARRDNKPVDAAVPPAPSQGVAL